MVNYKWLHTLTGSFLCCNFASILNFLEPLKINGKRNFGLTDNGEKISNLQIVIVFPNFVPLDEISWIAMDQIDYFCNSLNNNNNNNNDNNNNNNKFPLNPERYYNKT